MRRIRAHATAARGDKHGAFKKQSQKLFFIPILLFTKDRRKPLPPQNSKMNIIIGCIDFQ